ncbi:hypothetical protein, partial [Dactylosporangium fulvum]|uniref:hypothetical protein n=1 Tax=Dactylosporangium fulvum TaxID=53359 RepID=UPI0031D2454D
MGRTTAGRPVRTAATTTTAAGNVRTVATTTAAGRVRTAGVPVARAVNTTVLNPARGAALNGAAGNCDARHSGARHSGARAAAGALRLAPGHWRT